MKDKNHSCVLRHSSFVIARALLLVLLFVSAAGTSAQETNRYTKAADQLIVLINSGDYSAIEKMFNDTMQQALPSEKAADFFTRLAARFGKLEKPDPPARRGGWTVFLVNCERGPLDMSLALDRDNKIAGLNFAPHAAVAKSEPEKHQAQLLPGADRYTEVARRLVELINAGDYAGIQSNFNKDMDGVLPLDKSSAFFEVLTQQVGKIQKLGQPRVDGESMIFPANGERGALDMQLALDNHDQIAGLIFRPRADSPNAAPQKHLTRLSLPFKGKWLVFWGGDTKELNHHHDVPAQRFAFDFLVADENGQTHRGDGAKNDDYFCFGQEIYAPADGVVIEAIDGVRDNQPGVMNAYSLVGNCVVIQHRTNEVSVLAHLQRSSVVVKAGDAVKRGQLLGRCGNSGNSSEPHLHYQLQDSPIFQNALGIKVEFQQLVTTSNGQSEAKKDYSPVKGDIISPAE